MTDDLNGLAKREMYPGELLRIEAGKVKPTMTETEAIRAEITALKHTCPNGSHFDNPLDRLRAKQVARAKWSSTAEGIEHRRLETALESIEAGEREAVDRAERSRVWARMMGTQARCSWPTWEAKEGSPQAHALERCQAFAKAVIDGDDVRGLAIHGAQPGTGKTHLAIAIGRECYVVSGIDIHYAPVLDLLADARTDDGETTIRAARDASLLIIDDLGSQKGSPYDLEVLYRIIDSRWSSGRVTIVTCNSLDWPRLIGGQRGKGSDMVARISSRLRAGLGSLQIGPGWRDRR